MSTTTTTKTSKAAPASKSAPASITATITGSLARKIGKYAKTSGIIPSEAVLQFASIGESVTRPTPKSKKKELTENTDGSFTAHGAFAQRLTDSAAAEGLTIQAFVERAIRTNCRRPIYFPAESVQLLEELLEASGTGMSVDQYAEKFLQQEIVASLRPGCTGVPEILAGEYQLEHRDMADMQDVIYRWIEKDGNPQAIFEHWVDQVEKS